MKKYSSKSIVSGFQKKTKIKAGCNYWEPFCDAPPPFPKAHLKAHQMSDSERSELGKEYGKQYQNNGSYYAEGPYGNWGI